MPKTQLRLFYKGIASLMMGGLIILCACSSPPKQKIDNDRENRHRLNTLLRLNDLNEQAFAYHQTCLIKTEPMNEQFMENFKIVSNQLFDQSRATLNRKPELIVSELLERREYIQSQLTATLSTKGCLSAEALAAQKHYKAMGQAQIDDIKH